MDHFMEKVSETSLSYDILMYDRSIIAIIDGYYKAGAPEKARRYAEKVVTGINAEIKYYNTLNENNKGGMNYTIAQQNLASLNFLVNIATQAGDNASSQKWSQNLQAIAPAIAEQNQGM